MTSFSSNFLADKYFFLLEMSLIKGDHSLLIDMPTR